MKWLYLLLDLGSIFGPIILSFEHRVRFIKSWKSAFLASIIVAIPFLIWDILFTKWGFWGFNPDFLIGVNIFNLPLEEVLFFIAIPFACTFTYEVIRYYFRSFKLTTFNKVFAFIIPLYGILLVSIGDYGYYTLMVEITAPIVLIWLLLSKNVTHAGLAFLFSMIPFFIVNGILTGCCTDEPIVWYNEAQKVAPRIFTIPMEDVLYSFTMVVGNILVYEKLHRKFSA